ncbi:helix-turn-helix domain-containing protein [Pseudothermotoga sp.]|nr:XRE family transcriptional regulator [Pseudothermotoga sp.]MCX7813207.1 XRE family transcriptional regulator [Pseudothermotoga sp.]MDW8140312.1 XRE family transcriptional regulator [Pseudothermotoga sp.]
MIGKKIRELRTKLGISQAELAKRLGVDQTTVSYYERDKRAITISMLYKIAGALGVDVKYFFSDDEVIPIPLPTARKLVPVYDTNMAVESETFPGSLEPIKLVPTDIVDVDCAFIVHDKGMEPEIRDGDVVFVKRTSIDEIQNGEIVVGLYMNVIRVKRFFKADNDIMLLNDNTEYAPIFIEKLERFQLIGKVVEIRRIPRPKKLRHREQ